MADRISFLSYQPPGVYTQTILSSEGINLSAGFRIPTFVGSADVLIENSDVPVVRGSSKNFPVFVEREDVSSQATGTNSIFKTRFGPVVDPLTFLPTENAENVVITVNGKSTNPLLIDPENNDGQGEIHFTFSPDTADEIFISYYYIVEDTLVENEDLSHQILSSGDKIFYTKNRVIVDELGDITNDVTDIAVKVNGSSATVNALNGTTGQITLATEPGLGATLTVTYTYSNFIDKNDPLPNKFIHSISKVGNVSGRKDYTNGVDYNFSFERSINDVTFHEIAWGNSFALTTMQEDDEKFQYDWIPGDHLSIDVFDRPIFGEVASPVDTTQATTKVFKVQNPITDGSGKGTFLYDPDIDPGIFDFYIGADYSDAISGLNKKEHDITAAVGPVVTGAIDGGNKAFNVAHAELANAVNGTNSYSDEVDAITVTVDGSPVTPLTFDISTGDFTLTDAPVTSVAVAFNYKKLNVGNDPLKVIRIDGSTGYIYLNKAIDPEVLSVYVVYRTSFMTNETFTLTKTDDADGQTLGKYKIYSPNTGFVSSVSEGTHSLTGTPLAGSSILEEDDLYMSKAWKDLVTTSASFPLYADVSAGLKQTQDETVTIKIINAIKSSMGIYKFEVTSVVAGTSDPGLTGSITTVNSAYAGSLREGILSNQGYSGEPYIDPVTGFRFNMEMPVGLAEDDTFEFSILKDGRFDLQNSDTPGSIYSIQIPGITILTDEADTEMGVGDEVVLNTYNNAGDEPGVGDTYYVTYKYFRTDFKHRLYSRLSDVVRSFGIPNLSNPLSLAAKVAFQNGAPVVGLKPLPRYTDNTFQDFLKTENLVINPDSSTAIQLFKDAIDALEEPFDTTSEATPYTIVPLSDDSQVWSYLKAHTEKMSTVERRLNRYMIVGYNTNKKDSLVIERAKSLVGNRVMMTYPVSGVMDVEISRGEFIPAVVPGWYYGVAIAGLIADPGTSPSEPLLNKRIQGFRETGIFRNHLEHNQIAKEGVTILVSKNPNVVIRDALNTDMTSTLTKEPNVTFITDFVEGQTELVMNRFVGRPFINTILGEIETVFSAFLQELRRAGLLFDYKNIEVRENDNDRTIVELSAQYRPVLGVKYVFVTYRIQGI